MALLRCVLSGTASQREAFFFAFNHSFEALPLRTVRRRNGGGEDRTPDSRLMSPVLYHLSYPAVLKGKRGKKKEENGGRGRKRDFKLILSLFFPFSSLFLPVLPYE